MRIFPTGPTASKINQRKKSAPRNNNIQPTFASGRSAKNALIQSENHDGSSRGIMTSLSFSVMTIGVSSFRDWEVNLP